MFTFTDAVMNGVNEQHSQDDATDDSEFIESVPLTRDTDGLCTTECDRGDWSAEVKQENFPVVKEEPENVCCIGCYMCENICVV